MPAEEEGEGSFQRRDLDELIKGDVVDLFPTWYWHTASTSRNAATERRPPLLACGDDSLQNTGIAPKTTKPKANIGLDLLLLCTRDSRAALPSLRRPAAPPGREEERAGLACSTLNGGRWEKTGEASREK